MIDQYKHMALLLALALIPFAVPAGAADMTCRSGSFPVQSAGFSLAVSVMISACTFSTL